MTESDPELRSRLQEAYPEIQPPSGLTLGVWRRLAIKADRRWYQELFPSWNRRWVAAALLATIAAGVIAGSGAGRRAALAASEARYLSSIDPAYQPH